jgi:SAM-dependent methyltransferase
MCPALVVPLSGTVAVMSLTVAQCDVQHHARCEKGIMTSGYVHGYDRGESDRLHDQAGTLLDLLHSGTAYPPNSRVLEAGCGVGAQTVTLARNSPDAHIVSIDVSADSIAEARAKVAAAGFANVEFAQADIFDLQFDPVSFDHIFVCFVLEHLAEPVEALLALKQSLRPGGTITVIEGDHGSDYFHPDSDEARQAILCQVELQRVAGGNALIGRQLYPLMVSAGFDKIHVSPRMVYVDSSRPDLVEGFTKKTFTAMVEAFANRPSDQASSSRRHSTQGSERSAGRRRQTVSFPTRSSKVSGERHTCKSSCRLDM